MGRRIILTAALVCMAAPAWAQTRATYVLSNGERQSAVIMYGRSNTSLVGDQFHASRSGSDLVFNRSDVAVIDFVDGTPPASELQSLPGTGELLVMRDGTVQRGTLVNILRPGMVQWANARGRQSNIPIGEVRRIYLNTAVARSVLLGDGRQVPRNNQGFGNRRRVFDDGRDVFDDGSQSPVATAGRRGFFGRTIRVDGNQPWVDSGIDVRRGDRMVIDGTGEVHYSPGGVASAAGASGTSGNYPVPTMGVGALIAKVGAGGAAFAVGAGTRELTMPADGRLMLGINDDNLSDNSGAFSVIVRRPQ